MRIFSKKSFQFDHPAGSEPAVVVQALAFADVPDWVKQSQMYKLASVAGEVEIIENKADERAAGRKKPAKAAPDEDAGDGDPPAGDPPAGDPPAE